MPPLDPATRRALRARAHHLHPVVAVGHHGLTPAVLREVDLALKAHELIKVRVFSDDRAAREALLEEICQALDAAPVQHLGKLLVLWRPAPDETPVGDRPRAPAPRATRHGTVPASRGAHAKPAGAPKGRGRQAPATATGRRREGAGSAPLPAGSRRRHDERSAPVPASGRRRGDARSAPSPVTGRHAAAAKPGAPVPRAAATRAPRGVPRASLPRRRRGMG